MKSNVRLFIEKFCVPEASRDHLEEILLEAIEKDEFFNKKDMSDSFVAGYDCAVIDEAPDFEPWLRDRIVNKKLENLKSKP